MKIEHEFKPDPWGRDVCDRKTDDGDGIKCLCGQPRRDHVEQQDLLANGEDNTQPRRAL